MKKLSLLLLLFVGFLFITSCEKKEEITVIEADYVSLYELNKETISINTTNVGHGFW